MNAKVIQQIQQLLPEAMAVDRHAVLRELEKIGKSGRRTKKNKSLPPDLLLQRLRQSIDRKKRRASRRPPLAFDPALPISAKKDDIIQAIQTHPVVIVSGETGSGKSTQLPKFCLAAGRGLEGKIGCTQPRRIAATSVAARIADELGETPGRSVGYKIRFSDRTSGDTFVKLMTDGILLAEAQKDRFLTEYDTIIVDEAHERSLNIDFVLGLLKTLLEKRHDLKVIITSATIDTEKFSKAFDDAPVIEVSGRRYAVTVEYHPEPSEDDLVAPGENDDASYVELAVAAVRKLMRKAFAGDILVFMPTEQDIRETCEMLGGDTAPATLVLPLFARLSASDQARVFSPKSGRKIIVATNVAETSLTIPGIRYVVDTGLARIAQYNPRSRTTALPVVPVSKSSADQRKGRCGRMENGVAIRLFSEADYTARPLYTPPEILRANLAEVILRMLALRLGGIDEFPFIDRPAAKSVNDGYALLTELGAIRAGRRAQGAGRQAQGKKQAGEISAGASVEGGVETSGTEKKLEYRLTPRGKLMARLPVDPRISRMLIEARQEGCLAEVAILAAALSIQDPRERPSDNAESADRVHARFYDRSSDFLTLLAIWNHYQDARRRLKSKNQVRKFCREHYLSYRRMREWQDIHAQICEILVENRLQLNSAMQKVSEQRYGAIHRCILSGFLSNIAEQKEKNLFRAARGREVMVFPGSALFNRAGRWIVAAEMVQTSRLFARTVANIDHRWLEPLGGDLCRSVYLNPRWDARRGEVVATEQVSLFGLVIVSGRTVSFGKIDAEQATEIFIRRALMESDLRRTPSFLVHNCKCIADVRDIENRMRRRDLMVAEDALFSFYRDRLGQVFSERALLHLIRTRGGDAFLKVKIEDLMRYEPDKSVYRQFPDQVRLGHQKFNCSYRFEPGKPDDGLSVKIPLTQAAEVPEDALDWLVPGLLQEKITALIKGLPKRYRKHLVPVAETVERLFETVTDQKGSLVNCLTEAIHRHYGISIPASGWALDKLPEHLGMRVSIIGPAGEEIRSSRNKSILRQDYPNEVQPDAFEKARKQWERTHITRWDFGDLPERIEIAVKDQVPWRLFPALALADRDNNRIDLKLFRRPDTALAAHKAGVAALYAIHFARHLKHLHKSLALPDHVQVAARHFGGAGRLESGLVAALMKAIFWKNIRSQAAFYDYAEAAAPLMIDTGRRLQDLVLAVLEVYGEARATVDRIAQTSPHASPLKDFFGDLKTELTRLVPDNFIELYDPERLSHLPRYLKAILIRARRGEIHLEKDQAKAQAVQPFSRALQNLLQELGPDSSEEKRAAIEEFFWLLEEFKVSLFAQELKTAVPVSEKRLRQRLAEVERMV